MTTTKAIKTLLESNFQVKKGNKHLILDGKLVQHSEKRIKQAIAVLNTEGGYTFIRELNKDSDIIF